MRLLAEIKKAHIAAHAEDDEKNTFVRRCGMGNNRMQIINRSVVVKPQLPVRFTVNGGDVSKMPDAPEDLTWLSYCLHNLNYLGSSLLTRDAKSIVMSCVGLISNYEWYLDSEQPPHDINDKQCNPKATLERHAEIFQFKEGIDILCAIKKKAEGTAI